MNNHISVLLPADPKNAMPLRLFISGIATRAGFDIDSIDDIKTAVSEMCVLLLSGIKCGDLIFDIFSGDSLKIRAHVHNIEYYDFNNEIDSLEFSRMILDSLADEIKISEDNNGHVSDIIVSFHIGV